MLYNVLQNIEPQKRLIVPTPFFFQYGGVFYYTSLSKWSKARLPVDSPQENFAAFAEWVLVGNESPFTISPVDVTSHAPHPEPSQPTLMSCMEMMLDPTVNS